MGDVTMTDAAATKVKEQFNDLAAEFDMSWQDAFEFCSTSAALIAGNINAMKVDLDALDQDASTTITL